LKITIYDICKSAVFEILVPTSLISVRNLQFSVIEGVVMLS